MNAKPPAMLDELTGKWTSRRHMRAVWGKQIICLACPCSYHFYCVRKSHDTVLTSRSHSPFKNRVCTYTGPNTSSLTGSADALATEDAKPSLCTVRIKKLNKVPSKFLWLSMIPYDLHGPTDVIQYDWRDLVKYMRLVFFRNCEMGTFSILNQVNVPNYFGCKTTSP